jgi:hypothetical protein
MTDNRTETWTKSLKSLREALVDKTGEEPFLEPCLTLEKVGLWEIRLTRSYNQGHYGIATIEERDPDTAIKKAHEFVEKMPSHEMIWQAEARSCVVSAIAYALSANLPQEVIDRLYECRDAIEASVPIPTSDGN